MQAVAKSQKMIKNICTTEFKNSQTHIWKIVIEELKSKSKQIPNTEIDEPSELIHDESKYYNRLLLTQLCNTIRYCTLTLTSLHTAKIDKSKTGANNCHPETTSENISGSCNQSFHHKNFHIFMVDN